MEPSGIFRAVSLGDAKCFVAPGDLGVIARIHPSAIDTRCVGETCGERAFV